MYVNLTLLFSFFQFVMSEAQKELHRPFSASSFGLRHMEAYSGIPAHILNHLQPQFLHPGLSLGSGAFRPLADLKSFPSPSAFAPPKCLKIETTNEGMHAGHNHGKYLFIIYKKICYVFKSFCIYRDIFSLRGSHFGTKP